MSDVETAKGMAESTTISILQIGPSAELIYNISSFPDNVTIS